MGGIAIRVIRQLRGDKRTLGLILFAPILLFTLIYFLLGDSNYVPTIAAQESALPSAIVTALKAEDIHFVDLATLTYDSEEQLLIDHKNIDMVITRSGMTVNTYILENSVKSAQALKALQGAVATVTQTVSMQSHVVYNEGATMFQSLGFVFLAFLSFFFVFIISGLTLVHERTGGTLERLLMTPVKRWQVMMGYTLGYGFFAVVQSVLIVVYTLYVLKLPCAGSVGLVFVLMLINAVVAVLLGSLISIAASTELQMVQFIPILIVPQVFFCGIIPQDTIPLGLGNLGYLMPVFYSSEAIRRVLIEGADFSGIWLQTAALVGYGVVLWIINTLALKKFRTL
jgi:ABC-2 type transport system permease protein